MDDKAKAIEYFTNNKVPLRMQDALNILFKTQPNDVNGFVSRFFEELSHLPTISSMKATTVLDSKGQDCVKIDIYCTVRNREELVGSSCVLIDTGLTESSRPEEKNVDTELRQEHIDEILRLVNVEWNASYQERHPTELEKLENEFYCLYQRQVDLCHKTIQTNIHNSTKLKMNLTKQKLAEEAEAAQQVVSSPQPPADDGKKGKKSGGKGSAKKKGPSVVIIPDEAREKPLIGWQAVSGMSAALLSAGCHLTSAPAYKYIINNSVDIEKLKIPLPLITMLQHGKSAAGKSNCVKEFMIVPRPGMSVNEAVRTALKMNDVLIRTLTVKLGAGIRNVNDLGVICPTLDKPEQGLDMIIDAANQSGVEMGKDFFFVLNIQAQELFDYEKGKYEVIQGVVKAPDDLADFWNDLINRYPTINGLIDPLRVEEKESWNKICSQISDRCWVIGDRVYQRPGVLRNQQLDFYEQATSGILLKFENMNTIGHLIETSKKMQNLDNRIILSASGLSETNETIVVDIAVACQANFIKLGGLARGERITKYNRLIELETAHQLDTQWDEFNFPAIPPVRPTPIDDPPNTMDDEEFVSVLSITGEN